LVLREKALMGAAPDLQMTGVVMTGYVYLWEFIVKPDHSEEFERVYGPTGLWVALFRRAPGYVDTRLLRDRANPRRFITIDRWKSAHAYRAFRAAFKCEYSEIDQHCARLTTQEIALGEFDEAMA
jgi:heme-degrading monooxygenase HmoA